MIERWPGMEKVRNEKKACVEHKVKKKRGEGGRCRKHDAMAEEGLDHDSFFPLAGMCTSLFCVPSHFPLA